MLIWPALRRKIKNRGTELTVVVEGSGDEVGAGAEPGGESPGEGEVPFADEQGGLNRRVVPHPLNRGILRATLQRSPRHARLRVSSSAAATREE